ncbi:hypothetical protein GCM10010498_13120 [Streptomyces cavourensis]|nr:hypothetical protein GCM10010498_13120 [Streptomyces cavourensis]
MPSGWAWAVLLYGVSLSQGKTGRREETADTGRLCFLGLFGDRRPYGGRVPRPYGDTPRSRTVTDRTGPGCARGAAAYWFCGGSPAMKEWSRSMRPSLEAPPGEPRSSKNSTFAL